MSKLTHLTVATRGILKNNPLLSQALGATITHKDKTAQAVIAWGQRPSRNKALAFAKKHGLPIMTVEDGFLRSLDGGIDSVGASFIVDDVGVYFDLKAPSRLQQLIADCAHHWSDERERTACRLMDVIIAQKLSKYNATTSAPDLSALAGNDKPHVIIIDQVANDASIVGAGANALDFYVMMTHAKACYPDANLWIKAHPAGKGYFKAGDVDNPFYLTKPCNPIGLLSQAMAVYTVSSHMGFEALLLGKKVHGFGVSWYVGFGLTDDGYIQSGALYQQVKHHHYLLGIDKVSLSQLFYASYVCYSRYVNPATFKACDIETVMDYLILNRHWQDKLSGRLLAYEFSRWKVPFVRGFLGFSGVHLTMILKLRLAFLLSDGINNKRTHRRDLVKLLPIIDRMDCCVVWGQKTKQSLKNTLAKHKKSTPAIWCMEDGFIRSNGLGATLIAPLSVVMDDVGIYFDATHSSRLEMILSTLNLNDAQKMRANALHDLLLNKRVSKYNVKTKNPQSAQKIQALQQQNRPIHLVVGQVEDDASVRLCLSLITKNSELLAKVRSQYPNDIIVYKPHPDVEAGLRVGQVDNAHLADWVASEVAMPDCLDMCHTVHTISSLTGFEALLRGKQVVCYGLPFYAGFGLTHDIIEPDNLPKQQALARRERHNLPALDLKTLIFGTLIEYPLYHLPHTVGLATPENVIDYLYDYQEVKGFRLKIIQKIKKSLMQVRLRLKHSKSA